MSAQSNHWAAQQERGNRLLLGLTTLMVRYLPAFLMNPCIWFVVFYFYLTAPAPRRHIARYQARLGAAYPDAPLPRRWPVLKQFAAFGRAVCDRFAVWQRKIRYENLVLHDPDNVYADMDSPSGRGQIFVCSHVGNVEICRALVSHHQGFKLNVLVHSRHAQAFNEALPLTGVILTKMDGDSRGGAALSVRQTTGKPIKFIGIGEKVNGLEPFHPDRIASRILGMGDVLTLIEDVQKGIDEEVAAKMAKKLHKGKGFDLNDFKEQIQQMRNMGGLESIMSKMPGEIGQLSKQIPEGTAEKAMGHVEAIINSMTAKERANPALLKASRKRRIAAGSGTTIQEVNKMLKQFEQSQQMMKMFSGKGMGKLMNMAKGMKGRFPGM